MNDLSFDQENFEKIQSRLYKINDLEKKYGLSSVKELIDKKNELTPPNLALLIKKPKEKKLLWEKMQALLNDD